MTSSWQLVASSATPPFPISFPISRTRAVFFSHPLANSRKEAKSTRLDPAVTRKRETQASPFFSLPKENCTQFISCSCILCAMSEKLRVLSSWEEKEKEWEEQASSLRKSHPLKTVGHLPKIPGIAPKTKRFLKLKSLFYLLTHDDRRIVTRFLLKRPLHYTVQLLKSLCQKQPYTRSGDSFFYNLTSEDELVTLFSDPEAHLVIGFSYCQKPLECPSGRFTDKCQNDPSHPVCGQCPIGKAMTLLPKSGSPPLSSPPSTISAKRCSLSPKPRKSSSSSSPPAR